MVLKHVLVKLDSMVEVAHIPAMRFVAKAASASASCVSG